MTVLAIDRYVPAPPQEVYEDWTTPEALRRWWWPQFDDAEHILEAEEGGRFSVAVASGGFRVDGEFSLVEAGRRLDFSWVWKDADGAGPVDRVCVLFQSTGDGTNVHVEHETSAGSVDDYRAVWDDVLDRLADFDPDVA